MSAQQFTDSDLLDAFEAGLVLWTQDVRTEYGWERTWFCRYDDDKEVQGPTARAVILAVLLDRALNGGADAIH